MSTTPNLAIYLSRGIHLVTSVNPPFMYGSMQTVTAVSSYPHVLHQLVESSRVAMLELDLMPVKLGLCHAMSSEYGPSSQLIFKRRLLSEPGVFSSRRVIERRRGWIFVDVIGEPISSLQYEHLGNSVVVWVRSGPIDDERLADAITIASDFESISAHGIAMMMQECGIDVVMLINDDPDVAGWVQWIGRGDLIAPMENAARHQGAVETESMYEAVMLLTA